MYFICGSIGKSNEGPDRHPVTKIHNHASSSPRYFFLAIWARKRSSCSRNSGVAAGPKSSASNTWRISISVPPSNGARLSHSIASSFDFTCHSQNPAISSFVSAKGPSITVRLAPENLTRAPLELAWSPSAASITPAFTSSSLYFPISVRSSLLGRTPASESLFALTITMNRIVVSPFGLKHLIWMPLSVNRTAISWIDTLAKKYLQFGHVVRRGRGRRSRLSLRLGPDCRRPDWARGRLRLGRGVRPGGFYSRG